MLRLKELRDGKGVTQQVVADMLKITRAAYTNIENGKREPDFNALKRLADYFSVSTDYILGLTSDPYTFSQPPKSTGGVWIPVLGNVAAGIPIEAIEDIVDYEEIDMKTASSGEHFALKIKGDSMEPRIYNGDVVIVRKQSDVDSGDTAVVIVNGDSATVKRVKKSEAGIMLISNNPAYEPFFYANKEIKTLPVTILGKVVELRGKFVNSDGPASVREIKVAAHGGGTATGYITEEEYKQIERGRDKIIAENERIKGK